MKSAIATLLTIVALVFLGAWVRSIVQGGQWGLYLLTLAVIFGIGYAMSSDAEKRRYYRITASWLGWDKPWSRSEPPGRRVSDD